MIGTVICGHQSDHHETNVLRVYLSDDSSQVGWFRAAKVWAQNLLADPRGISICIGLLFQISRQTDSAVSTILYTEQVSEWKECTSGRVSLLADEGTYMMCKMFINNRKS